MPLLPFYKTAYSRGPRQRKIDPQARFGDFLKFGYNHGGSGYFKEVDGETRIFVSSRDVTWDRPRDPLIPPGPTAGAGPSNSSPGTLMPAYVKIMDPAIAGATPAAPVTAPVPTLAPSRATALLAPGPDRRAPRHHFTIALVGNSDVRMPGRTRGETRMM